MTVYVGDLGTRRMKEDTVYWRATYVTPYGVLRVDSRTLGDPTFTPDVLRARLPTLPHT